MSLLILPSFCNEAIWVILIDFTFLQVGWYVYALCAMEQGCLRLTCLMIFSCGDGVSALTWFGGVCVTRWLRHIVNSFSLLCEGRWLPVPTYLNFVPDEFWLIRKEKVILKGFVRKSILLILDLEAFTWLPWT